MTDYASTFPLSSRFRFSDHAVFAVATSLILSELSGSRHQPGRIHAAITALIGTGVALDGAEPAGHEIGKWQHKFMCDEIPPAPVDGSAYFAWVSSDFWDYDPPLVIYTKVEFMTLLEDCCRNFVAAHPNCREEFAAALAANGMSLDPTAERP
ncbi:hypothetical protein [Roseateles sp.]|uniref:hypothetical protein n=1 Tax=Roseateles sp. TaxID=1971397 RepID=UPI003BA43CB4